MELWLKGDSNMSQQTELTTDEILSKLDSNSRKARFISIGFTAASVVVLIVVLFLTYRATEKLNSINDEVAKREKDLIAIADEQKNRADGLKSVKDALTAEIQNIAQVQNSNKSCEEKKQATDKVLTEVSNVVDLNAPKTTVNPTPSKDPGGIRLVYIQIVDEAQRAEAKKVAQMLRAKGLNVPGIELVEKLKGKIPQTQVRYFNKSDENNATNLANQINIDNVKIVFTPLSAPSGQMEIWFAG
jgi:hypothetical protein